METREGAQSDQVPEIVHHWLQSAVPNMSQNAFSELVRDVDAFLNLGWADGTLDQYCAQRQLLLASGQRSFCTPEVIGFDSIDSSTASLCVRRVSNRWRAYLPIVQERSHAL